MATTRAKNAPAITEISMRRTAHITRRGGAGPSNGLFDWMYRPKPIMAPSVPTAAIKMIPRTGDTSIATQ
jgi:hypothetical protein